MSVFDVGIGIFVGFFVGLLFGIGILKYRDIGILPLYTISGVTRPQQCVWAAFMCTYRPMNHITSDTVN